MLSTPVIAGDIVRLVSMNMEGSEILVYFSPILCLRVSRSFTLFLPFTFRIVVVDKE